MLIAAVGRVTNSSFVFVLFKEWWLSSFCVCVCVFRTIDLCESWCLRSILNFSEGKGVARSHALHASLWQPRHHSSGSSPHPQRLPLRHCFLSDGGASVVSQLLSFWRQAFGGCRRHWRRWICRNVHSET